MRVVLMYSLAPPSAEHLARLRGLSQDLDIVPVSNLADAEAAVGDAEVILGHRFLRQTIARARRLRWVQTSAAGIDRLPLAELAARGVTLTRSTLDAENVAAHAVALAWAVARALPRTIRNQSERRWDPAIPLGGAPKQALVLGQGPVGRAIAGRLAAQGIRTVCGRQRQAGVDGAVPCSETLSGEAWREALPACDWCFLALPLSPGTERLFDEPALRALPRHAVLVNVGRGETLDTTALLRVLREGHLLGVGLDVTDVEPLPAGHPLWEAPRVILTPHIASHRPGRSAQVEAFFEAQLNRYLNGQRLEEVVDLAGHSPHRSQQRLRRHAKEPLVSVVVPAYKPAFLQQALDSAIAQTYRNVEIVVSDNCPTEDVRSLVTGYATVRYHRNPIRGVYSNFRSCIRLARGDYVKFLLDDDLLTPDCVAVMAGALAANDEIALVAGGYSIIDDAGQQLRVHQPAAGKAIMFRAGEAGRAILSTANNFVGSLTSCMFRRRHLPLGMGPWFYHAGAVDCYYGLIDLTMILDLAWQGKVVLLPQVLSAIRRHRDQLSNATLNPLAFRSIASWRPLVMDARAFGLISDHDLQRGLHALLPMVQRWEPRFPELSAEMTELQAAIARYATRDASGQELPE